MNVKIILCLPLAILLVVSSAFATNITINFSPNDTISVAEGSTAKDTVTFNINGMHKAPIALYVDTTGFTSVVYDTLRQGADSLTRMTFNLAPDYNDATGGYYGIDMTAYDNVNADTSATLWINVLNTPRAPHFTNPSRDTLMTVYQNVAGTVHFRAVEPDTPGGDSVRFFDNDNVRTFLQDRGWAVTFTDSVLNFTPPGNVRGIVSPSGFKILAARAPGAPSDTILINFNVLDTIPPGEVTSLTGESTNMPFGVIRLAWNAPHEDGGAGGAVSSYMIRYALSAPSGTPEAWWNAAQTVTEQPPVPQSPGSNQHVDISGRTEYQPYWFGIKSTDSSGNVSAVTISSQTHSRQIPPAIYLLGDLPDTVRADSILHFIGVAADSGGIIQSIRYQGGAGNWSSVSVDSTADSSSVFIRKYFHFTQPSGSGTSITVQVRARDAQDSTTISKVVYIDNVRPLRPGVVSIPADSVTSDYSFTFTGTKERDAVVYQILVLGPNPGIPIRITEPGDHSQTWNHMETVYYQGLVTFKFYCMDNAGNVSDTTRLGFWLIPSQEPPNIIVSDSVDYNNSTVFHPLSDSFSVSFPYPSISQFDLSITNRMGTVVYSVIDSLTSAPGRHTCYWDGMMNSGSGAGTLAPDGAYMAKFSARVYPVTPFDIPIQVGLILDSYAPYELSFFPQGGEGANHPRVINNSTVLMVAVGDTGSTISDSRAEIIAPYMALGDQHLAFTRIDSILGSWALDLGALPALPSGQNTMTLFISDAAGNQNSYTKVFDLTSVQNVTGFVNYPNPFAPSREETKIAFVLGQAVSDLTLEIYDSAGGLVFRQDLDAAYLSPQAHEFPWDGKSSWGKKLNNGVYFARLTGGITSDFLKIAIVDR